MAIPLVAGPSKPRSSRKRVASQALSDAEDREEGSDSKALKASGTAKDTPIKDTLKKKRRRKRRKSSVTGNLSTIRVETQLKADGNMSVKVSYKLCHSKLGRSSSPTHSRMVFLHLKGKEKATTPINLPLSPTRIKIDTTKNERLGSLQERIEQQASASTISVNYRVVLIV